MADNQSYYKSKYTGSQIDALLQKVENSMDSSDGSGTTGKDGVTYTPYVDPNTGVISWTNNGGLENPTPVNITGPQGPTGAPGAPGAQGPTGPQGERGRDGQDGVSIRSVEQTVTSDADNGINWVTITLDNGKTSTVSIKNGSKGSQGEKGADGEAGYTPVRGKDYWTAADIAEIKGYVDDAILGGAW